MIAGHPLRVDESLRRWDFAAEADVQAVFEQVLKQDDVVADIGANFGLHTLLAADIVGSAGAVFAFEPVPFNVRLLTRNVNLNGFGDRVRIVPSAVSDSPEPELAFSIPEGDLTVTGSLGGSGSNQQRVPNLRLDDFAGFDRPLRFLKIDVEGAELAVLKGGEKRIRADQPVILVEVHVYAFEQFGTTLDSWRDYIQNLGYRETALNPRNYGGSDCYHALLRPENHQV